MRAYFFGNMYLSSIQQGIQAAHVVADMFIKYPMETVEEEEGILYDWASVHKTMILLNGGYSENLHDLVGFFDHDNNPYPTAFFNESIAALDGAITSVGIILPEKIYKAAAKIRSGLNVRQKTTWKKYNEIVMNNRRVEYTNWEVELINKLNTFDMAR